MFRHAVRRVSVALLLCVLLPALVGWSNGPNGGDSFGTHDWVLYEANRLATADGVRWLDWNVAQPATDDPDTVLHDTYHHVYDVWSSSYGDAPTRVAELYAETVSELKAGDRVAASKNFGLLAHYYADINNPLHTDQVPEEESIHSAYELAAQTYTDEPNKNSAWVVSDGLRYVPDATAETEQAATTSHGSYQLLVSEFTAKGMDAQVLAITRQSLNRAANDLADLIYSAARDALLPPLQRPPDSTGTPALASESVTTSGSVAASRAVSGQGTASANTAPASTPSEPVQPASSSEGGQPQTLLFWAVMSAAFAAALFGALRARERGGR